MTDDTDARTTILANAERLRGRPFVDVLTGLTSFNTAAGEPIPQDELTTIALDLAAKPDKNGSTPQLDDPRAELTSLLGLHTAGLRITRAEVYGRGAGASATLFLSDGSTVEFETIRDVTSPAKLSDEIVATTGVIVMLKKPEALRAAALLRALAEHHEVATEDAISRDWGVECLQAAQTCLVDMTDQMSRWRAFSALNEVDPASQARTQSAPIGPQLVVLIDRSGMRLVRCGWFLSFVREHGGFVAPDALARRMERVGWRRRGREGWIKATPPGRPGVLRWRFYVVPDAWEEQVGGE